MTRRQPPRQYPRTARVNEVIRETLAGEIERLSDPRLGFVTVTGVEISKDLRIADVYYSALGTDDEQTETADALQSAIPHLRSIVGREVRLKYNPELRFRVDPSIAQGQRIEEVIRSLHDGEPIGPSVDDEETE
jgi:ribosome-binding factor A